MEFHDNEVGLAIALVDKSSIQSLSEEWNAVGVYMLLGTIGEDGGYNVYVGKSPAGLRTRIMEHVRGKQWVRALMVRRVVLYGLTSSQAGWLEGDLYDLFSTAQRARVDNQQRPRDDSVPPYELRMLRSLRDPVVRVLRMLGYETESAPEIIEPVLPLVSAVGSVDPVAAAVRAVPAAASRRSPRTAFNVSIADLLTAGMLRAGERLVSTSNAWPATATVNADATITWEDRIFPSASGAASAVCEGTPVNGWDFWAVESAGEATRLSTLRRRYLDATPAQTPTELAWVPPPEAVLVSRSVSITSATPRRPRTEFKVTVADLLEAGLLRGGDQLVSTDPATAAQALVGYDGAITWNGTAYGTLSTAAQAVKGDRNTNGWHFWAVQGPEGEVRLDDLRMQHLGVTKHRSRSGAPARYDVELKQLLEAGLVDAGDLLISTSRAWPAVAYVDPDAAVVYQGTVHPTPSAAGAEARGGRATNGWDFWALEKDDTHVRLRDVRAEFLTVQTEPGDGA